MTAQLEYGISGAGSQAQSQTVRGSLKLPCPLTEVELMVSVPPPALVTVSGSVFVKLKNTVPYCSVFAETCT